MEHNWYIDIKLHFMTTMHDIYSNLVPERMTSQQKDIIPWDRRIVMR